MGFATSIQPWSTELPTPRLEGYMKCHCNKKRPLGYKSCIKPPSALAVHNLVAVLGEQLVLRNRRVCLGTKFERGLLNGYQYCSSCKGHEGGPRGQTHFALVVSLSFDFSLLLEPVHNILVAPSNLVRDPLQGAVLYACDQLQFNNVVKWVTVDVGWAGISTHLPAWFETENSESSWDDHLLHLVLCGRNTLVQFKTFQCGSTTRALVWDHTPDRLVEDPRWCTVVERTCPGGVDNVSF